MKLLIDASVILVTIAMVASLYRFIRGPRLADRIAAFDLLTAISIGLCAALSVTKGLPVLFDVAVLVCLVSFVGTMGFAALLDKQPEGSEKRGRE